MQYLDFDRLAAIDASEYQSQKPYPWVNPEGLLTAEGFEALRTTLPDKALFTRLYGKERRGGQQPHDRYTLEYEEGLPLSEHWQAFIAELEGRRYRDLLCHLLGVRSVHLSYHWHYTANGCSVSPHCDHRRKLGSHIFYLNTEADWDESWGGETYVLDDAGRFRPDSAPAFEDFDLAIPSEAMGNRSLIFSRKGNSWHGVKEIRCPEDRLRKVFIAVINRNDPVARVARVIKGRRASAY